MPFSRAEIEKPNRTLFIRNVNYKTTEEDVRKVFEEYGTVTNMFSRIEKRGMVFVTFSDIRDAKKAKDALQNTEIGGRAIDVHYSLPRSEDDSYAEQAQKNSQDTLFVSLREGQEDFSEEEAREYFSQFGDVKDVRSSPGHTRQRFVEFYDVQECDKAIQASNGASYKDGVLFVRSAHNRYDPGRRRKDSPERSAPGPRRDRDRGDRGGRGDRGDRWDSRPYDRPSSHERYPRDPQMNQRPSQSGVNHIIRDLASALKQQAHERSNPSSSSHNPPPSSYAPPSSSYYESQPPPYYSAPPPPHNYSSHSYAPPPRDHPLSTPSNPNYSIPTDVPIASLPLYRPASSHPPPHEAPPSLPLNHSGQVTDILRQLQHITSQVHPPQNSHPPHPPPDNTHSLGSASGYSHGNWGPPVTNSSPSYPHYPPPSQQPSSSAYPPVNSNNRFLSQSNRSSSSQNNYSAPYMP